MKIPKGADVQLNMTDNGIEMHITAALATKEQANELIACIRQIAGALDGPKRQKRQRVAQAA